MSRYSAAIVRVLRGLDYDACYTGPGPYLDRQARAVSGGARAYMACHVNSGAAALKAAGNPRNHTIFYDYRASAVGGRGLANAIVAACQRAFPRSTGWRTRECRPDHWTSNAYALIEHTGNAAAVTIEPGFIDESDHQWLWTNHGLERLGKAIAAGTAAYLAA